jgi:hypothetical protein
MLNPGPSDLVRLPTAAPSRCIVVVDTEEEFDWSGGFSRDNVGVRSLRSIDRVQDMFDRVGVKPTYVVDYPVVSQADGYEPLRDIHASGRCVIGAHLHPWVNPPFEERVSRRNSFPGNLPPTLEAAKLAVLTEAVGERFGARPTIYKAGRYGIGRHTAAILEDQGFDVDLSVCPHMNYSAEGGPDFTGYGAWPYWFGRHRRLLELPLTVGFTGALNRWGPALHPVLSRRALAPCHLVGILARLRLLDKIWLSPEGYVGPEHRRLVRRLRGQGLGVFTFAFHSPSVVPGNTPYVRTEADLADFLSRCRDFLEFFLDELKGRATTPVELAVELTASAEERVSR